MQGLVIRTLLVTLALGSTFAVAEELALDADTLLLLRFDGSLDGVAGETPSASAGVSFESGLVADAVRFGIPGYVRYGKSGNIDAGSGTVEFWIRPNWDGDQDAVTRIFFSLGNAFNNGMVLSIDGANNLRFIQWGDDPDTVPIEVAVERGLAISGASWRAGQWHHIAATWDGATREMAFYVDGSEVGRRTNGVVLNDFSTNELSIGAAVSTGGPSDAAYDEFRISNRARTDVEVYADYLAGLEPFTPPTYQILRGTSADGLTSMGMSALPWIDPDDVLEPTAPSLLFYRIDRVARLHMLKRGASVAVHTAWPSQDSTANSDDWLVDNHTGIGLMEPRLLVLNFSNDTTPERVGEIVDELMDAVQEATRWHGYEEPRREPFLDYSVERLVDLRDDPPVTTCDGNSTRYPRKPGTPIYNFEYSELYGEEFAEYYGYPDPLIAGRFLTLDELVAQGIVHEVWFLANHGSCGAPLETIELKQYYDPILRKVGYGPAGNGHDSGVPWIDRSLRLTFINPHRGIGCAMENLGHGWEGYANHNAIGYLTPYLREYAGFDLDDNWGLPFQSFYWYGSGDNNSYPDPGTLIAHYQGVDHTIANYVATGGNVHFTPNGRSHYDLVSPDPVMSTIKSWRTGNGSGGEDLVEPFTIDSYQSYYGIAPDCMGAWLVYWRQNMPGLQNSAKDDLDEPMWNWWPFLFY